MSIDVSVIENEPATIESYVANLDAQLRVANILMKSGLTPNGVKSPEAILTAIWIGKELGFSPLRAVNSIAVINGKPTLEAMAIKAKVIQAGGEVKTIEWDRSRCKLSMSRGTWVEEFEYTMDDAAIAGLVNKDNWKRNPKHMLYARCVCTLARNMYSDILMGLYGREEMEGEPSSADGPIEITVTKKPRKAAKIEARDAEPEWLPDPTPTPAQVLQNAIDGEDWAVVGAHVIETKCSLQGMTVRDAAETKRETLVANLRRFKSELDRMAVAAYLEAFPPKYEASGDIVITDEDLGGAHAGE